MFWGSSLRLYLPVCMHWCQCLLPALFSFIFISKRDCFQGHRRETYDKIMLAMDSVGLGIFTVVGVNTGIRQGYMDNVFLLVFLWNHCGVGGGLLRDMMASVPPYIFVKHIYACASIIGAFMRIYESRVPLKSRASLTIIISNCSRGADPISGSTLHGICRAVTT